MINVNVQTDITKLKVKLFELRSTVTNRAIPSSLNKTAAAVRAKAVLAIRLKLKPMKAKAVRKRISIIRANPGNQTVIIRNRRVTIPPGAFKLPGHGNKLYVHVGPKHRMITSKSGKSVGRQISSGYQIAPVQSLQVQDEFKSSSVQQVMQTVARERFPILFEREMKYYASRYK